MHFGHCAAQAKQHRRTKKDETEIALLKDNAFFGPRMKTGPILSPSSRSVAQAAASMDDYRLGGYFKMNKPSSILPLPTIGSLTHFKLPVALFRHGTALYERNPFIRAASERETSTDYCGQPTMCIRRQTLASVTQPSLTCSCLESANPDPAG